MPWLTRLYLGWDCKPVICCLISVFRWSGRNIITFPACVHPHGRAEPKLPSPYVSILMIRHRHNYLHRVSTLLIACFIASCSVCAMRSHCPTSCKLPTPKWSGKGVWRSKLKGNSRRRQVHGCPYMLLEVNNNTSCTGRRFKSEIQNQLEKHWHRVYRHNWSLAQFMYYVVGLIGLFPISCQTIHNII
jgi:hypothetical protein